MAISKTGKETKQIAARIADAANTDVLLYNSPIERPRDSEIINLCCRRRCRPNLLLVLVTEGGDPDAAYRIARSLQERYTKFSCCVSGYCKSAGTLVALGANELVFYHHGEIGPLDIQMAKKDELWESESGLTVMTALTALHEKAQIAFDHFFISLATKSGGRITVRTGSEIAAKLTQALYAPITDQIDPLHVGEAFRAMAIAKEYGQRLMRKSRNFTHQRLEHLISEYPSHGFVIDKAEAQRIFRNVRDCTDDEALLINALGEIGQSPTDPWVIEYLTDELKESSDATESAEIVGESGLGESAPKAGGDAATNEKAKVAQLGH